MTDQPSSPPPVNVIVASHERSGTHFMINTLVRNFGFDRRWIDSDITSGADFYISSHFRVFLDCMARANHGRVVKEHHDVAFLEPLFDVLRERFVVLYVYRNPADVMCSFWRYINSTERREGPHAPTPGALMRMPPSAGMLRYQMQQHATILERWRAHVDAWTTRGVEQAGVVAIGYEELSLDFDRTVARIAARLGVSPPATAIRPPVGENAIVPGEGRVGGFAELMSAEDIAFIREATGPTLHRLGLMRYLSAPEPG